MAKSSEKMKNFLFSIIFLLSPLQPGAGLKWDMEFVANGLVIPIAKGTQEITFCICQDCLKEDDLNLFMKWLQLATMHP